MRRPKAVLAVCAAALALSSCAGPQAEHRPQASLSSTPLADQETQPATAANTAINFGSDYRFPSGLVVSVSTPDVFRPSDNAYPRAERAVAFGVVLVNDGEQPYRLSNFSVSAMVDGVETKQVVDTTQGYNGIVDADRDLGPGKSVRLRLAFAVSDERGVIRMIVRPDTSAPEQVVFRGST